MSGETDYVQRIGEYVAQLKNGNHDERMKTKRAVGTLMRQALVELTLDKLQEIERCINFAIYDCFVDGVQVAGLLLIDELVDIDYMEGALKTTRFANYLRGALPTEHPAQAELVATTLGKIAMEGGILASEVIEAELRRCVEWLAVVTSITDSGNRRYGAIFVINELTIRAPHIIATRLEVILAHISNGMKDIRHRAQQTCSVMLGSLLKLLSDRSLRTRDMYFGRLFEDACELIDSSRSQVMTFTQTSKTTTVQLSHQEVSEASFRGGCLMLRELYAVPPSRKHPISTLLLGKFSFILDTVLEDLPKSKGSLGNVLEAMTRLLTVMAKFHSEGFGQKYLGKAVDVFFLLWKTNPKNATKASLLKMIGNMFKSIGAAEPVKLDPQKASSITSILRTEIASKIGCSAAAVLCVADLARSLPASEYEQDALQLITLGLENMGVTAEVCEAVSQTGIVLTGVKDELHKRMLYTIRMILAPKEIAPLPAKGKKVVQPRRYTEKDVKLAIMMLSNVAAVAPERVMMNKLWNSVVPYLTHESLGLRMAAIKTTGELLTVSLPGLGNVRSPIASEVLEKMLAVAAADIDSNVRMAALKMLPPQLDDYLCRPTIIKMLVTAAYDMTEPTLRFTALSVLGRLSTKQPGMILPPLRKLLISVLNELSHPRDNIAHQQSSEVLGHIIASAPKLAHMYAVAIRDALLPKLTSTTASLKTAVMCTLNTLASVGGKDMMSVDEVMIVVMKTLEEGKPSLQRRLACLQCLASLMRAVDWEVHPYERFPGLLSLLLRILQLPQPNPTAEDEIRGGVLKCLGVAGAYEPYRLRYQASRSKIRFDKRSMQVLSSLAPGRGVVGETDLSPLIPSCGGEQLASHLSQYNPNLSIRVLLKVVDDSSLSSSNHKMAVGAIVMVVHRLDPKEYPMYLEKIYNAILSSMQDTDDPSLLSFIIQQVRILSEIVGLHSRPFLEDIINAVSRLCSTAMKLEYELLIQALSLVIDLRILCRESFLPHVKKVVPLIGMALTQRRVVSVSKALLAMEVMGSFLEGFLTILIPLVLKCIGEEQLKLIHHAGKASPATPTHNTERKRSSGASSASARGGIAVVQPSDSEAKERLNLFKVASRALHTIHALSFKVSLREFSAKILHALLRILTTDPTERQRLHITPKSFSRTASNEEAPKLHRSRVHSLDSNSRDSPDTKMETLSLIHQLEIEAVHVLCGVVPNMQPEAKAIENTLIRVVRTKNLHTDTFCQIVINHGTPLERPAEPIHKKVLSTMTGDTRELVCNPRALSGVVDVSSQTTPGEWIEWLRVLSIELVRESPSPALRACANLAQVNLSVAKQLFNAAFVSCYLYLPQPQKGHLLQAIILAIQSPTIPPDVLQPLLSLAEFMEHMEVSEEPTAKAKASVMSPTSFQRVESCQMAVSEVFSMPCSEMEGETLPRSEVLQGTPQGLFETTRADVFRPPPAAPQSKPVRKAYEAVHVTPPLPLPSEMDLDMLAEKAENCQMYAKALHYRELIFIDHLKREVGGMFGQYVDGYVVPFTPIQSMLEQGLVERTWKGWVGHVVKIVRLHQHLRNHHSAHGILSFALANFDRVVLSDGLYIPKVEASVYEELHQWDRAKEEWLLVLERLDAERAQNALQQTLDITPNGVRNGSSPRISSSRSYEMKGFSSTNELWSSGTPSNSITSSATPSLSQIAATYKSNKVDCDRSRVIQGLIKACRSLGEWSEVLRLAEQLPHDHYHVDTFDEVSRAAWMLQEWDVLSKTTAKMHPENVQKHVWHDPQGGITLQIHEAVLAIHKDALPEATASILTARKCIQPDIGALASESYSRAYPLIVKLQVLAELEEVIEWKQRGGIEALEPDQLEGLLGMWKARLYAIERRARYWEENLAIRRILVPPQQQLDCWLKFVSIARKANKPDLARSTLKELLEISAEESIRLKVTSVDPLQKYLWHKEEKEMAPGLLFDYLDKLSALQSTEFDSVKGKYYRKLGEWYQELHPDSYWLPPQREVVMRYLRKATHYDPDSWKAWHRWALMNHRVMRRSMIRDHRIVPFVLQAAQGFTRVIQLGTSSSIQDLLRLLGLWFAHGHIKQVEVGMRRVFESIATNNWLLVIPQIVARLHHSNKAIRSLLQQLLVTLGKEHGQAVVYPLICVLCSEDPKRAQAGADVLDKISTYDPTLVAEGRLVATSLAKVALILAEQWSYGIDEARWLCFNEKDVGGAIKTFHGLHYLMDAKPVSEHEKMFHKQFSVQLSKAHAYMQAAERYVEMTDTEKAMESFKKSLDQALLIYSEVYKDIDKKLSKMPSLDLAFANPDLCKSKNLSIAVPGTYRPTEQVVTIKSFNPKCYIIPSKQRPRKISINGSDGQEYIFLLKGREDLRQDERVMQLFTLINQLLNEDRTTAKLLLSIELYPVIPLASSAGLIGWLCNAETLYSIVKEYRRSHRMSITLEKGLVPDMVEPEGYDKLTLYQKVDVFEHILEKTNGDDLSRMLWLKSRSSEVWLSNRTTYTRSLAVMSMVGFVMGLGDRHPSNLMLDIDTRKVIHIDFGDCFEVASRRAKFPEQVPFRLTRLLIKAMDLAGVEGSFRKTSEDVMRVLRKHKDSLMSILSSFLHDPLINWRLIDPGKLRDVAPDDNHPAWEPYNDLLNNEESYSANLGPSMDMELRHRSMREQAVRSVISRRTTEVQNQCQQVVTRQAVDALNRIRRKLDGIAFKMKMDIMEIEGQQLYTFDYHDPLFVGETAGVVSEAGICGECEVEPSVMKCNECNDTFCGQCCETVHQKRRNLHHNCIQINARPVADFDWRSMDLSHPLAPEAEAALERIVVRIQAIVRGHLVRKTRPQIGLSPTLTPSEPPPGPDATGPQPIDPADQVKRLIHEATAHENLAVAYAGWCAWW